jgi:hypothetical protein
MAQKVRDLQSLLELFIKHLNAPAALIEIADTRGGPVEVMGEKSHLYKFTIHLHPGDNTPHPLRVVALGSLGIQSHFVITQDVS